MIYDDERAIQQRKGPAVPDAFDPYYSWLAIPPEDQPPNHYQLLGLKVFESNADVIDMAADRQMAHLRTFQRGPHAASSQRLLNEVAAARLCLRNPEKRAAYDKFLRSVPNIAAAAPGPATAPLEPEAHGDDAFDLANLLQPAQGPAKRLQQPVKAAKPDGDRRKKPRISSVAVNAIVGGCLILGAVSIFLITLIVIRQPPPTVAAKNGPAPPRPSANEPVPSRDPLPAKAPPAKALPSVRSDLPDKTETLPQPAPREPAPREPAPREPAPRTATVRTPEQPTGISPSPLRESTEPSREPSAKNKPTQPQDGSLPPGRQAWRTSDGKEALEADLEQVEQDMLVLKKADGSRVRVAYDRLSDADQERASRWVVSAAAKIWTAAESPAPSNGPGTDAQSFELAKVGQLNKALQGAFVKDTLTVVDVAARQKGASGMKLTVLSTTLGTQRGFILPIPEPVGQQIAVHARLVVDGRLSYKFGVCPACEGTGYLKCPHCTHGRVSHMVQQTRVFETCSACKGTGRLEACKHVYPGDWEPWGSRKLPDGAYSYSTTSEGARRAYVILDDVRLRIYTATKLLSLQKKGGKPVVDTEALGGSP